MSRDRRVPGVLVVLAILGLLGLAALLILANARGEPTRQTPHESSGEGR